MSKESSSSKSTCFTISVSPQNPLIAKYETNYEIFRRRTRRFKREIKRDIWFHSISLNNRANINLFSSYLANQTTLKFYGHSSRVNPILPELKCDVVRQFDPHFPFNEAQKRANHTKKRTINVQVTFKRYPFPSNCHPTSWHTVPWWPKRFSFPLFLVRTLVLNFTIINYVLKYQKIFLYNNKYERFVGIFASWHNPNFGLYEAPHLLIKKRFHVSQTGRKIPQTGPEVK